MQLPLVYQYFVAGVEVTTRKKADLPENGFADCCTEILFPDNSSAIQTTKSSAGWIKLPGGGSGGAWMSPDGSKACINYLPSSTAQCAVEFRRLVPFSAALQGRLTLHASAVKVGDSAVAFIGESGVGKSTLAAGLDAAGFRMLSDDLLPVRKLTNRFVVPVGRDKYRSCLDISHIFFLSRNAISLKPEVLEISGVECMRLLMLNGFGELKNRQIWKMQFETYGEIAASIHACQLIIPDDITRLEESIDFVIEQNRNSKRRAGV